MGCCGDRPLSNDRVLSSAKPKIVTPKDAFLVIAIAVEDGPIIGNVSGHVYPQVRNGEIMTMRRDDFEMDTRFVRYGKDTARLAK